ncbi:hypothetical protein SESBI_44959 [Sesbania bispinosa]|nr:hypothetical protein SESBI_44959 [Sesbania bispinosa]
MALSSSGSGEGLELEEKSKGTQKIATADHMNAFQYITEKDDSFVLDIDHASSSGINKDSTHANSKITRNLSRKGSQRWVDMKVNGNGSCMPEKQPVVMPIGSMDHSINPHIHHQITIINGTTNESKCITRRNSFNRSSSWALDPKRVLLFFSIM